MEPALATINLSYDFGQKLDGQVQNLLIGNVSTFFGPFTFVGKRANWSYVAHSRIITANLPPSNSDSNKPDIYISCGDHDENGFYYGSIDLAKKAISIGYPVEWRSLKGGHMVMNEMEITEFFIKN